MTPVNSALAVNKKLSAATFPLSIAVVVIDLDGTLLDTAPDLAYAANQMLAELDRPALPLEQIQSYVGNGVSRLVKRVLTENRTAEPDAQLFALGFPLFEKYYAAHVSDKSRPFPGVVEALDKLRAAGYTLVCITNKAERFTLPLLKDTALLDYFDLVLSGDSLPRRKPDPLPLLHAMAEFKIAPEKLLIIGDSINDIQAARAAGCPVFCVCYGYQGGAPIGDADALLNSLLDALPLITRAV